MANQAFISPAAKLVLFVLGYALLARVGTAIYTSGAGVAYFWPANALVVTVLLAYPKRQWLLLMLAAATEVSIDLYDALPWLTCVGLGFANAFEAAVAARLMRSLIGAMVRLNTIGELFRFSTVAALSPALSAWFGAGALHLGGIAPDYVLAWIVWWMGDALGLLLVTPILLAVRESPAANFGLTSPARIVEAFVLAAALACTTIFVFSPRPEVEVAATATHSLIFPFIAWAALRFGLAYTAAAMAAVSVIATLSLGQGAGAFGEAANVQQITLMTNAFLMIATLTGMVLAVAVAERRRAETSLRNVVEASPIAKLVVNREGLITFANMQAERTLGYPRKELLGRSIDILVPEEVRSSHWKLRDSYFSQPEFRYLGRGGKLRARRKDGTEIDVEVALNPIDADQGTVVLASIVDISEHQRMQEALRISEERLRLIADNVPALIAYMDANARYRYCNRTYEVWTGMPREAFYGRSVRDIQGERAWEQIKPYVDKVLAGEKVTFERDMRSAGIPRDAELSYVPDCSSDGRVIGYYVLGTDVTQRKTAEAALRKQQDQIEVTLAEKTVLLNEIHHRVKNNLQIVSGLLYLQSSKIGDPVLKSMFEESQHRIDAMAIIHQLLYEGDEVGRVRLRSYLDRLGQLLASSHGAEARGIALRLEIDEVDLDLQTSVPVGLIVNELVSNALKHAFPHGGGGEVRLELRKGAALDEVVLSVSDNGVGLPGEIDPKRAKSLGLRLVASLAEQVGGQLEVRQEQGSRFTLRFSSNARDRNVAQI